MFRETAVFATTPHHLFRSVGGWIMRGAVPQGSYLEEAIGTAHQNQTQLVGNPRANQITGFHRIFDQHQFFTIGPDGTERPLPATQPSGTQITKAAVAFAPGHLGVIQQLTAHGQRSVNVSAFSEKGEWRQSWVLGEDEWQTAVNQFPALLNHMPYSLAADDALQVHPAGWLIQQTQTVKFWPIAT